MPMMDLIMLGFVVVTAVVGIGWLVYEMRSDDEK